MGATFWGPSFAPNASEEWKSLALGLRVEAGYAVSAEYELHYDLANNGAYSIPVYEPDAGGLRLDAPYGLVALVIGGF